MSRDYAFADPSLVEARFDPDVPLEQREMLLVLHAIGARIYAGVRVGEAGNETRGEDGREASVFFWNYRTLQGHPEAGQRDFEVWKWLDTGEVEFRTHAVSRPAGTNAIVRLGFRLLGRHKQVEFGRRACTRMAMLTEAGLRRPDRTAPVTAIEGRLLTIYLRDHHALLIALRELARRIHAAGRSDEQETLARKIREAADDDRFSLEELLRRLDSGPSRTRHAAVWAGARLGQLKLNGRVLRPSPLSAVVELEGCRLLVESNRALWAGLAHLGIGPADATVRARRAEELLATCEHVRLRALHQSTGGRLRS